MTILLSMTSLVSSVRSLSSPTATTSPTSSTPSERAWTTRQFDEMPSLLVEAATVRTPGGAAEGREAVAQARRNHQPDEPTQHVITNPIVELEGDRAQVRANLVVNFAAPARRGESLPAPPRKYTFGEIYHFDVVRTPEGWRFSGIETTPVWISPLSAAFLAAALRGAGSAGRSPKLSLVQRSAQDGVSAGVGAIPARAGAPDGRSHTLPGIVRRSTAAAMRRSHSPRKSSYRSANCWSAAWAAVASAVRSYVISARVACPSGRQWTFTVPARTPGATRA
jgi:hypothetical protein